MNDMHADLETAAKDFAGNWRKFGDFGWHDEPEEHSEDWGIFYTRNRDTQDSVTLSNADVIDEAMAAFDDDVQSEHHGHWGCGWVDGWAVRVFRDGVITDAFKALHEMAMSISDYPVLDEEKMSEKERELEDEAWSNLYHHEFDTRLESTFENWLWNRMEANGVPDAEIEQKVDALVKLLGDLDTTELFHETADAINEYWEHGNEGPTIHTDKVADAIDMADLLVELGENEAALLSRPFCPFDPRQMYLSFVS